MEHSIYLVPTDYVSAVREHVLPFLKRLVNNSNGCWTPESLVDRMETGHLQLWMISNGKELVAVVATEINPYPAKKVCNFFLAVGNGRKKWMHLISEIEDWAREQGCDLMEAEARPGWARAMKDYKKTKVILEKWL